MIEERRGPALVLGAGIAGLAAALRLSEQGYSVTVVESGARAGGRIESEERDGYLLEWGPNSFPASAENIAELVAALGLGARVVGAAPAAAHRFVYLRGRLHRAPSGPASFLANSLLSVPGRLRALAEPLIFSRGAEGETVEAFFRRRFGRQVAERLVRPFVSGIYAGAPEELEMNSAFPTVTEWERARGGVLMGAIRAPRAKGRMAGVSGRGPYSFAGGMEALPRAMAARLSLRLQCTVREVRPIRNGWEVDVDRAGQSETLSAERIVVALPAYVAAPLLASIDAEIAAYLTAVPQVDVALLQVGVSSGSLRRHDGFGFLTADPRELPVLGAVWASSVFPQSAPAGKSSFRVYLGGRAHAELLQLDDGALIAQGIAGLGRALGEEMHPELAVLRRIPRAIPQYVRGHRRNIAHLRRRVGAFRGLALAGNYLDGVSMDLAAASGFAAARELNEQDAVRAAAARGG